VKKLIQALLWSSRSPRGQIYTKFSKTFRFTDVSNCAQLQSVQEGQFYMYKVKIRSSH